MLRTTMRYTGDLHYHALGGVQRVNPGTSARFLPCGGRRAVLAFEIKSEAKSRIKRATVGLWNRYSAGTGRSMLVTRNGEVRGRLEDMQSPRVPLFISDYDPEEGTDEEKPASSGNRAVEPAPFIDIDVNFFGEPRSVFYRWPSKSATALFDVPAGSPAARRFAAMEASPIKRLVFPIIAGIGKVSWALLAPILKAFFSWLFSFLPEINIPWPQINIPWPEINIPWPDINITWPEINIPWSELPEWVVWLLGHPKLWIPILVGIVAGIIAMRRARKSKKTREAWEAAKRDAAQSEQQSPHQTRAYQDARPRGE
ncbi:hypothetical protein BSZ39_02725 [Bowdeniella nasicola]|uniref:Uncharacterized protein n=1 Tax=Bowdeniella nasicola TaxID=208480 RepID=A0A1Q5Q4I4_9ACTO|nr:hypothetical protein [Bowdeniella nasicola]OKL54716.1 hypothetical protein BSZ39_02725 [Bowdeniella nasicola]